jgi:hypothetical protein
MLIIQIKTGPQAGFYYLQGIPNAYFFFLLAIMS